MTNRPRPLLTLAAAALLAACGGNPEPATPAAQADTAAQASPADTVAAQPAGELTDERAMELARGYVAMLHSRDFAGLWERVTPESRQRFGTFDAFRQAGDQILTNLGAELAVESETVEAPQAGMPAARVYHRVSMYENSETQPVRLSIAMTADGSIAAIQLRPAE